MGIIIRTGITGIIIATTIMGDITSTGAVAMVTGTITEDPLRITLKITEERRDRHPQRAEINNDART